MKNSLAEIVFRIMDFSNATVKRFMQANTIMSATASNGEAFVNMDIGDVHPSLLEDLGDDFDEEDLESDFPPSELPMALNKPAQSIASVRAPRSRIHNIGWVTEGDRVCETQTIVAIESPSELRGPALSRIHELLAEARASRSAPASAKVRRRVKLIGVSQANVDARSVTQKRWLRTPVGEGRSLFAQFYTAQRLRTAGSALSATEILVASETGPMTIDGYIVALADRSKEIWIPWHKE